MKKQKYKFFAAVISITVLSILGIYFYLQKTRDENKLVVLSFCSLAPRELPVLNANIKMNDYPNISKFLNESVYFKNSHGSTSWSNTSYYIFTEAWKKHFKTKEEQNQSELKWKADGVDNIVIRIPGDKDLKNGYIENYSSARMDLPINQFDSILEKSLSYLKPSGKKLLFLHFKLMHYPFLTSELIHNKELLEKNFNQDQLKQINKYLKEPQNFPDKYAFFQYLFGDEKFKQLFTDKSGKYISFLTTPAAVLRWKNSKDFKLDQDILLQAYRLRLKILDSVLGRFIESFKKESNLTIAFIGDHGETFGNREYLSHAETPYDEVTQSFFSVSFPNQKHPLLISEQVSQRSLGRLIEGISKNQINLSNIRNLSFRPRNDDIISSYSCQGDIASLRINNKWKFFHSFRENTSKLFDIEIDPNETIDLSDKFPEEVINYKTIVEDRIRDRILSRSECIK